MWNEKIIKVIPAVLFLFCLLNCFEIEENLEVLKTITILLNKHS
ncbi:hypothetical protein HpUBN11_10360 [Helicobacter pylori]